LAHLREALDLADPIGGDWLAAGPRVQLGVLAVLRGRLDEARPLLEALDLSVATRSTPVVTLCLAGYAQLALADDDPDRAALLEGAAEGLRRRVGLPAWPHLRPVEGELVARVRHTAAFRSIRRSSPAPCSPNGRQSPSPGTSAPPRRPEPLRITA